MSSMIRFKRAKMIGFIQIWCGYFSGRGIETQYFQNSAPASRLIKKSMTYA